VPRISAFVAQQLYDIPEFTVETTIVVTNLPPTAPYRGAGRPEAAYAMERAVDAFAREAGLDPVEVRRKNLIPSSDLPRRVATGAFYDSGDYRAALDKAVELVDVDAFRAEQEARRVSGDSPIGLGFGAFVERAGGPLDSGEFARVEVDDEGSIVVYTGSTSNGQGHETVWAQVAGTVFDLPLERIRVIGGDTKQVADGWGSMASRSAQIGASGVWRTANEVREMAIETAAELLEASAEDIVLEGGVFGVVGTPGVGLSLADVARHLSAGGRELAAEELFVPGAQTFPYGVHAAEVEVDVETGEVRILRIVAVDDCGNVLNPMIVEGQVQGSLVQGIGQALYEEVIADDYGQIMTTTLVDYLLPHAEDIPPMTFGRLYTPAPSNPLGLKGTGEGGCIGGPPAIVNAVLDALAPYGVTAIDMPLKPATVWRAISEARKRERIP
jgi:carbon-monoxide dehydrogenase large subunit